ncbi:MAG TPA: hypothetical protein VJY15_14590 [Candidatus Acidoferrum sp.]|nr:hypothetical protein [Candidatus Acidoferrum sp.]
MHLIRRLLSLLDLGLNRLVRPFRLHLAVHDDRPGDDCGAKDSDAEPEESYPMALVL